MKALIPAAGLGTRFLPATKCMPKELLPVVNKPVIQYVVEEALAPQGVDEVIVINSHQKPQIEQFFSQDTALADYLKSHNKDDLASKVEEVSALPVSFCYQDEPKGLGHAVLQAADLIGNSPFFVLLGDYFVPDKAMCKAMQQVSKAHGNCSVIAVAPVPYDQVSRYGIIAGRVVESPDGKTYGEEEPGAVLKLSGLVEKPSPEEAPTNLFIVGRYLLSPRVMKLLQTQAPGAGGEIQLTDALARLLEDEEMYAVVVDEKSGCDTGTPAAWAGVNTRLTLADPSLRATFFEELGENAQFACSRTKTS